MKRLALGPPRGWELLWDQEGHAIVPESPPHHKTSRIGSSRARVQAVNSAAAIADWFCIAILTTSPTR
eukprot:1832979-Amphidinium_carterae.2